MTEPLVSVLMTSYNREQYIAEAIESVLCSTYKNFELIIVDDCSSDNTVAIAKSYALSDARIKVYENEKNLGDYLNRNHAASFATGKYIKYVDSDDMIYKWGLFAMVEAMEKFPETGLGLMALDLDNQKPFPFVLDPVDAYRHFYFKGRLIGMGPTGAIIKTEAFRKVGGFSGKLYIGDTELWYKLAADTGIICISPGIIWWREHVGQQIRNEAKDLSVKVVRYKLSIDMASNEDCPLPSEEKKIARKNIQNLFGRNVIKGILRGNVKNSLALKKMSGLSFLQIISSIQRNKYPRY